MSTEVNTKVIEKTLVIDAPVERVYAFWADMAAVEAVLPVVESIEVLDERTTRWTVQAPFSTFVQFVAVTETRTPNRYVKWGSTHGAGTETVISGGELFFEPVENDRATRVRLRFTYDVPSASAQQIISTLAALGYPEREFDAGLTLIKEHLEGNG
ncbi:MAG: hypothetical protein GVY18_11965 [Bacteroidetes bacterium]|jgi:uncharacterized membrane protein|nr:hypothetical protein [Bacteroidota bacterium]